MVTPISSFLTKTLNDARGTSPVTGMRKGESTEQSKTIAHLMIRARFPTIERERRDLEEGRHEGYFALPIKREANSDVELPFLSSSDHPVERLATYRIGLMFDSLQEDKVKRRLQFIDPNVLEGTVSQDVYESATTRFLLNRKIISDSPGKDGTLASRFRRRFIIEVRSLLEYDPDFFNAPNAALRNLAEWNAPERIVLALNNSPGRFALERLVQMIDELGEILVQLATSFRHARPAVAHTFNVCPTLAQLADQIRPVQIAAGFAHREEDLHNPAFLAPCKAACKVLALIRPRLDWGRSITDCRASG